MDRRHDGRKNLKRCYDSPKIKAHAMRTLFLAIVMIPMMQAHSQIANSITLESCYEKAEQNYPLARQRGLLEKSTAYSLSNISRGSLPQISIAGQATYQSDVTQLPLSLPGVDIPRLPKEQFRLYGEINQPLTDLATIKQNRDIQDMNFQIQEQSLEAELYKVRERINQLFFGALLIDAQLQQNELLKKDIATTMSRVDAAIKFGTELKSSLDKLKAEQLKVEQRAVELRSGRTAYLNMLGLFINQAMTDDVELVKPDHVVVTTDIDRAELKVFDLKRKSFDLQNKLITTGNLPKFGVFFQGGIGRPSPVNFFSDEVTAYYIGGIRLNWSLSGYYTSGKQREILAINQGIVDSQRETFLFNTGLTLEQMRNEISRLQELVRTDDEIIALRTAVKEASNVQLENGVITVNDFLREVNAEDQARQNKLIHETQLLMAEYNFKTVAGN